MFGGQQVNKGQAAPDFTLKDQNGKPVSLKKYKGKPVVVYFYPADETPGCTKQVLNLYVLLLSALIDRIYSVCKRKWFHLYPTGLCFQRLL